MANEIELKTIRSILDFKFYVPSYQRGYRWTKQQVTDLLEDIWEFSQKELKKDEYYCLQPIIVKNKFMSGEEKWEVIDGQQRLTTIYIILTYIRKNIMPKAAKPFTLEYETRKSSKLFLENIDEAKKNENIDFYHIYSALDYVTEWFTSGEKDETTAAIEIYNKILNNTKFIWYQIDNTADPIDIFTRINLGKIPLTNSELIKALFLKKDNFGSDLEKEKIYMKQLEISKEWDQIEYSLQNDEFWYFICNGEKEYETRIEFIFNMMSREINKNFKESIPEENSEYFEFTVFNKLFQEEEKIIKAENSQIHRSPIDNLWLEIKKYFMIFEEWFNNRETYHLIGYLITIGIKIDEIKRETEKKTKSKLIEYLNFKIKQSVSAREVIENWDYNADKKRIKNTLLLFNIISLISNERSNIRYPFDKYKIEKWDIEHIHAVSSEMPSDKKNREGWLKAIQNEIEISEEISSKIKSIFEKDSVSDDIIFSNLYNEILDDYGENADINNISNLTLLDAATNRSYKNAIFPIKRKKILENDRNGTFIPICTKNVFLKYYSNDVKQMMFWGEEDREDYLRAIKETLRNYLPEMEGRNNEQ